MISGGSCMCLFIIAALWFSFPENRAIVVGSAVTSYVSYISCCCCFMCCIISIMLLIINEAKKKEEKETK